MGQCWASQALFRISSLARQDIGLIECSRLNNNGASSRSKPPGRLMCMVCRPVFCVGTHLRLRPPSPTKSWAKEFNRRTASSSEDPNYVSAAKIKLSVPR